MSDGFFRLVTPFGRYDADGLLAAADGRGLGVLVSELRELESAPVQDGVAARYKKADDASAVVAARGIGEPSRITLAYPWTNQGTHVR